MMRNYRVNARLGKRPQEEAEPKLNLLAAPGTFDSGEAEPKEEEVRARCNFSEASNKSNSSKSDSDHDEDDSQGIGAA